MGVAGKLEIDGIARNVVGIVWLVGEEHGGFAGGNTVQGGVEIGGAAEYVVDAGEPEAGAVALDGTRIDWTAPGFRRLQGRGDAVGIGENVVISENRPKRRAGACICRRSWAQGSARRCLRRHLRTTAAETKSPVSTIISGCRVVDHGDR